MIIDNHQHLILPTELQIEQMNKAGVDKAILFTTTPHPEKAKTPQKRPPKKIRTEELLV